MLDLREMIILIIEARKKAAAEITESKYFSSSKISKNDLLKNVEEYELISDLGLNTDQFKDLELFWLEGVNPWQQRYVELNRLDNIIPVKKLKKLRLSDCIYFKNTNLTELENIEILSLTPHENHHKKNNDNIVISDFEKLKSLKILDISGLCHFYNKELFHKTLGYTGYSTNIGFSDTYSYIDLDLSKVNQLENLKEITPTYQSVNDLESEEDEAAFVQAFRKLMRTLNVLQSYTDFDWDDLPLNEQEFEDYKGKYLDIYEKVKKESQKEKISILDDIDFELKINIV